MTLLPAMICHLPSGEQTRLFVENMLLLFYLQCLQYGTSGSQRSVAKAPSDPLAVITHSRGVCSEQVLLGQLHKISTTVDSCRTAGGPDKQSFRGSTGVLL
jgi:hypothetical protein